VGFVCFGVAVKICGLEAQTNTSAHRLIPKQLQSMAAGSNNNVTTKKKQ
jgi:hypothetical protein